GSDELRQTRAATERGCGICVGGPVDRMHVRIIAVSDESVAEWHETLALPPGHIGEIVVRGPVVTAAYFNRPEATKLAKIHDAARKTVWHRMGDLGYLDYRGRLWFCGRKSQRVMTVHGTLFTIPCESVFNTHPEVFRSALVGVRSGGATMPALCV